jgi:hypothetical protein
MWAHGASVLLADAYPDRHVLGLGIGGAPRADTTPLKGMIAYLDELDAFETPNPKPASPVRRILAAYGPKMLALARDRAAGTLTYHVTVAHTAQARDVLGPDAFLGVEHPVLSSPTPPRPVRSRASTCTPTPTPRTTSQSSAASATPTRRSATAAATASSTTPSGETSTRSSRSSIATGRRGPTTSPSR